MIRGYLSGAHWARGSTGAPTHAPQTDRTGLAHFVKLIGVEPREAEFDDADNLIKLSILFGAC